MGYLFCGLALGAFSVLAVSYKLADRLKCDNHQVNFFLFSTAAVAMLAWFAVGPQRSAPPVALALGAGMAVAAVGGIMAFRLAVPLGPIATTWTLTSLSLVIPTAGSMLIWRELPSLTHCLGFLMIAVSIVLMGVDIRKGGR
jgi:drug/metabolite transporter (DMT)-like permease